MQFDFQWNRENISEPTAGSSLFERLTFVEQLRVHNSGFVFDPRLLTFQIGGSFAFFQEQFSSPDRDESNDTVLLGMDAGITLFGGKPYTLTAFLNRSEETFATEFSGTSTILLEGYGAHLSLREIPLPSILAFRRERFKDESSLGPDLFRREEDRMIASYRGRWLGETSDLSLAYEYNDVNDLINPDLGFLSHDGTLTYNIFFGPYLERDFRSRLHVFSREGRFGTFVTQSVQRLQIDHTDDFTTDYVYTLLLNKTEGADSLSHLGSAGLQHQLFSSLTSNLRVLGNFADVTDGQTYGYGGTVTLGYTKRIPFGGRFSAGGSASYRIDSQQLSSGELQVSQEPHLVKDFELIFLDNQRVVEDSIRVFDEAGEPFRRGFDYTVVEIGVLTALERIPSGRFRDGEVILVDYRFTTGRDLKFGSLGYGFNLAVDYDWISVFFQRDQTEQNLLQGEEGEGEFLNDTTDQTVGARLRWSRPGAQASLLAEYRDMESREVAFTSPRFVETLSWVPARTVTLNATLNQSFFDFSLPEGRQSTNILVRLGINWRPLRYLLAEFSSGFLLRNDTLAPNERLFDARARLLIVLGRTQIIPNVAVGRRRVDSSDTTEVRVGLTLVRKLF